MSNLHRSLAHAQLCPRVLLSVLYLIEIEFLYYWKLGDGSVDETHTTYNLHYLAAVN